MHSLETICIAASCDFGGGGGIEIVSVHEIHRAASSAVTFDLAAHSIQLVCRGFFLPSLSLRPIAGGTYAYVYVYGGGPLAHSTRRYLLPPSSCSFRSDYRN